MAKVTLEFEVDELAAHYDSDTDYTEVETIEHAIIASAARQLLNDRSVSIGQQIDQTISKIITETVEAGVREKVAALVVDAFTDEYPVINSYGKPTGETTSILAHVESLIHTILYEKVNYKGQKQSDTYGNRTLKTRWQWHLEEIATQKIDRELKRELDAIIENAKREAKERIVNRLLELDK